MKTTGRKAKIVVSGDGAGIASQAGGRLLIEALRATGPGLLNQVTTVRPGFVADDGAARRPGPSMGQPARVHGRPHPAVGVRDGPVVARFGRQ